MVPTACAAATLLPLPDSPNLVRTSAAAVETEANTLVPSPEMTLAYMCKFVRLTVKRATP